MKFVTTGVEIPLRNSGGTRSVELGDIFPMLRVESMHEHWDLVRLVIPGKGEIYVSISELNYALDVASLHPPTSPLKEHEK